MIVRFIYIAGILLLMLMWPCCSCDEKNTATEGSGDKQDTSTKRAFCSVLGVTDKVGNRVYFNPGSSYYTAAEEINGVEKRKYCSIEEARKHGYRSFYNSHIDGVSIIQGDQLLAIPGFEGIGGCGCYFHPIGLNLNHTAFAYRYNQKGISDKLFVSTIKGGDVEILLQNRQGSRYYLNRNIGDKWKHIWKGENLYISIDLTVTDMILQEEADSTMMVKGSLHISEGKKKQIVFITGYCGC